MAALLMFPAGLLHAQQPQERQVVLTDAQRDWLRAHPTIVLGVLDYDAYPVEVVENGQPRGLAYDYLVELTRRLGVSIEVRPQTAEGAEQVSSCEGPVDIILNRSLNRRARGCLITSMPYASLPLALFGRVGDERLDDPQLRGLRVLTYGTELEQMPILFPGAHRQHRSTWEEAIGEVLNGDADAVVSDRSYALYQVAERQLTDIRLVRGIDANPALQGFASAPDRRPLIEALDAALASLSLDEREAIDARWLGASARDGEDTLPLSRQELEVLGRPLRLGVLADAAPLSFRDSTGGVSGIAKSYAKELQRVGVRMEHVVFADWSELERQMQQGTVDVVIGMVPEVMTGEWSYSSAFAVIPNVIVTRAGATSRVLGLAYLQNRTVAVVGEGRVFDQVRARAGGARVISVVDTAVGLGMLRRGEVDAYVGNLAIVDGLMRTQHPGRLQVSAPAGIDDRLMLAARAPHSPLVTTFERILGRLGHEGQAELRNRWFAIEYTTAVPWRQIAPWAVPLALIVIVAFSVLMLGYMRIRREVQRRQSAETRLDQVARNLPVVVYQLRHDAHGAMSFSFILGKQSRPLDAAVGTGKAAWDALIARIDPRDRKQVVGAVAAAATQVLPLEGRFRLRNGKDCRWIHSQAVVALQEDGAVEWTGYWVDVTESTRQAAALEAALAARSQFLATMSHEIRTPMAGILGMLEVMRHDVIDPRHQRTLGIIDDSAQMLRQLLDDILDLSRLEAGTVELEPASTDLRALVRNVVHLLKLPASAKGVSLQSRIAPALRQRHQVDALRFRQIIFNLASNGIKFTGEGRVMISIDVEGDDAEDAEDTEDVWQWIQIRVCDTGIGIEEERLAQLFEPFVQAGPSISRRFGGTGLGLSICRRLVEQMQGSIQLTSAVGIGTQVMVRLRLQVDGGEPIIVAPRVPAGCCLPSGTRLRVLVAEDQEVNRILMAWRMEQLGVECEIVENGHLALHRLNSEHFDLLITDCQMPVMDGYELVRRIRAAEKASGGRRLPILAMTASAMPDQVAHCIAIGMDEVLTKPATMEQVCDALRRVATVEPFMTVQDASSALQPTGTAR